MVPGYVGVVPGWGGVGFEDQNVPTRTRTLPFTRPCRCAAGKNRGANFQKIIKLTLLLFDRGEYFFLLFISIYQDSHQSMVMNGTPLK